MEGKGADIVRTGQRAEAGKAGFGEGEDVDEAVSHCSSGDCRVIRGDVDRVDWGGVCGDLGNDIARR